MTELSASAAQAATRQPGGSCRRSFAAARARGCGRCRARISPSSTSPILAGASLFQRTLQRIAAGTFATPIAITAAGTRFMVADQAGERCRVEIALEPEGRDTLAAVIAAACLAARRDPEAMVLVHAVRPLDPGHRRLRRRRRRRPRDLAEDGGIVDLRPHPDRARPPPTATSPRARRSAPAPTRSSASSRSRTPRRRGGAHRRSGCLWNAGIFCFRADAGLREIEEHAPDALAAVQRAIDEGAGRPRRAPGRPSLPAAPKISFDHAVMERTTRAAVIAADFAWSDIGDWKARLGAEPARRATASPARAGSSPATSRNSYLRSDGPAGLRARRRGPRGHRHRRRRAGRADRPRPGGEGSSSPSSRPRASPRRARRRGCTARGAGTRPWTSATASG